MKSWLLSRSPRERILLLGAAAVAGVILLLQGVLIPGQAAARSASARNTAAAGELAEARAIAASLRTDAARGAGMVERLVQSATEHGLTVIEHSTADGVVAVRLASDSSVSVLAWADAGARQDNAALRTLSISRDQTGGVIVDASFSGAGS